MLELLPSGTEEDGIVISLALVFNQIYLIIYLRMIISSGYKTQTDLNHRCRHTIIYHANLLSNAALYYD